MIIIGKVLSTHGLKGLIKIISFADIPEKIFEYNIFIENVDFSHENHTFKSKLTASSNRTSSKYTKITLMKKFQLKNNIFVCELFKVDLDKYDSSGLNTIDDTKLKIDSIEQAKKFQNLEIYLDPKDLINTSKEKDEFYEFQLINAEIFEFIPTIIENNMTQNHINGEKIGIVRGVLEHKNINKMFLEIELLKEKIIHLAEFNVHNFPKHIFLDNKLILFINVETLNYLKTI